MATQPMASRIGIYGGSFDPPHLAHAALVTLALSQLQLDRLHVVPTGQAWHKPQALSGARHRVAMCSLAFSGMRRVLVDEREILREGASYTVETLRELRQENPGSALFLIIGQDQALAFGQWKSWPEILEMATVCVAPRHDDESTPSALTDNHALIGHFVSLPLPPMAISATHIRHRVSAGLGLQGLVSEPVARYIAQHHLYRNI